MTPRRNQQLDAAPTLTAEEPHPKHFFDTVFHICADDTRGLPYGLYVHGNLGVEGAVRAVGSITAGMGWTRAAAPVEVIGAPDKAALEACWELGATLAATICPDR